MDDNWDRYCDWAEGHCEKLHGFLETWGPHCGAPRDVFRGHLVRLLLESSVGDDLAELFNQREDGDDA